MILQYQLSLGQALLLAWYFLEEFGYLDYEKLQLWNNENRFVHVRPIVGH